MPLFLPFGGCCLSHPLGIACRGKPHLKLLASVQADIVFSVLAKLEKLEKTMQEIKLSLVTSQPDDDLTLDTILPNGKKLNTLNELSNFEKQLGEDDDIRN